MQSACPLKHCAQISLFSAPDIGSSVASQPIYQGIPSLQWEFSEFDIAALSFPAEAHLPPAFLHPNPDEPQPNEELFALGYPRCQRLELTAGTLATPYPLGWYSSIKGTPGMSGAPVFTGSGLLVGTIRGATSLRAMLSNTLLGSEFPSQVMRSRQPSAWSALPERDGLAASVERATLLQRHAIRSSSGHQRLWMSLEFQEMVNAIARRAARTAATQPEVFRFVATGDPPTPPFPASDKLGQAINNLVLRSQLESWGLHAGWLTPLGPEEVKALSAGPNSPYASAIEEFRERPFPGSAIMQTTFILSCGALAAGVITLWGMSIGFVIGRMHHRSALWRGWVALLIALGAWPLSFFIFLWRMRRSDHQMPAASRSTHH